jgi:hypothetical protein
MVVGKKISMFLEKDHHSVVAWGRCEEDDNIVQGR